MKNPMKVCPACGAEMAKSAKACPHCGAKNKKPIYKKWWFWLLIVILVVAIAGGSSDQEGEKAPESNAPSVSTEAEKTPEAEPEPEPIAYAHYNVTELFDTLKSNALKAEKTFQDQYVELEGYLSVIDSDGKYIGIGAHPDDYDYLLQNIRCEIENEEQLNQILEMSVEAPIVVRGQITEIGEILGYCLDIDSIN